ncbi:MAG: VCBS repeat-containing protein [Acidobacteriaceae bacterium]|nr:VCBS repeat-containing protein [Acidobacteriaceae bacterium]
MIFGETNGSSGISTLPRRGFLSRCWHAVAALLLNTGFRKSATPRFSISNPEFHIHPSYREQTPIDSATVRVQSGHDVFTIEVLHDNFIAIFDAWASALLQSPQNTDPLKKALSSTFLGSSWQPIESHLLRPASDALEVRRFRFPSHASLTSEPFLADLRSGHFEFLQLVTAEFQITQIDPHPTTIATRLRYDIVGTGHRFHREQRTGYWSLTWTALSTGGYRITRWQMEDQVRSRSTQPFFTDVTESRFEGVASYYSQLIYGVDHWRTVMDAASGIDIYGHNGVSVGDIDGDGLDDLYICQPAGLPNRLFRNRGDGTFEDMTESSGLGLLDNTACAIFADFDNDGRQDLVVVRAGGPLLFLNQGAGRFKLKPDAFRFATTPQGTFTGAAAADYNRDGWLDIYFCLYAFYQGSGQYKYPTPYFAAENGPPNFLMQNNGDGTFSDVTAGCGLDINNNRYSFCCAWNTSNDRLWPDLYVVNDFGRKNFYRTEDGHLFRDIAEDAGVEDAGAGMSVCWLDYDNDGRKDLYVANMWTAAGERISADPNFQKDASPEQRALYRKHASGNSLFHGDGRSTFRDTSETSNTSLGRWSWSSDAWDIDHDGYPDIYVANGMISGPVRQDLNSFFWRQVIAKSPNSATLDRDYEQGWNAINELVRSDYTWSGYERNVLFVNNRDGTFSEVSGALGLDFPEDGRSFLLADFDGDGRQEMLLKNRNAPQLRVLKNTVPHLPPAIAFRLVGTRSNRDAIGATVILDTSSGRQTRVLQAGSGFLSQHSKEIFFGLGDANGNCSATIRWPSGHLQRLQDLPANHRIFVTEGNQVPRTEPFRQVADKPQRAHSPGAFAPDPRDTWLLTPFSAPDFSLTDSLGKAWTPSSLRGRPLLLAFWALTSSESLRQLSTFEALQAGQTPGALQVLVLNVGDPPRSRYSLPILQASQDVTAVYNLLSRYVFDRHRDLEIPTSFLIDTRGEIVKIYRREIDAQVISSDLAALPSNDAERLSKALPFPGVSATFEYGRNFLSLGSIFFLHGYTDAAADFFSFALKLDAKSAEALYGLGSAYLKSEKLDQAQLYFEKATRARADYSETIQNAWNNLGLLAARTGDTTKAIVLFKRALQLDPDYVIALENLGNAYRQQRNWEDARSALERVVALRPADPEANYSLGMVFAQSNDPAKAEWYLNKALERRPTYREALNNLGVLYLRTHRRDQAVSAFEKCIQIAPDFNQAYLSLARLYVIEGNTVKAREVLRSLLSKRPDDAQARQAMSELDK